MVLLQQSCGINSDRDEVSLTTLSQINCKSYEPNIDLYSISLELLPQRVKSSNRSECTDNSLKKRETTFLYHLTRIYS